MKSFGTYKPPETVGLEFIRLAVPHGGALPRSPVAGELFIIEADYPEPKNNDRWFSRGLYCFDGMSWGKLSDGARMRSSAPIGAQMIELEGIGVMNEHQKLADGYWLAAVVVNPSNRKAKFSGTASAWIDLSKPGHVWLSIYRGSKLVGLAVEYIESGKPKTMSVSFLDAPGSNQQQTYTLKINTDTVGHVYVNGCAKSMFDGVSQTAFTVAEDNN